MTLEVPEIPNLPRHRKPKNRPTESAWRQQKLPARRPVLTINAVCPSVMGLGLIIFGLGLVQYFAVLNSQELVYDYTDCPSYNSTPAKSLALLNLKPQCTITFEIKEQMKGNIKFYYQLDGFYQNFRTYSSSRNDMQLDGDLWQTDGCKPFDCEPAVEKGYTRDNSSCKESDYRDGKSYPYVPCGTIANSMFNDTFELFYHSKDEGKLLVPFSTEGVLSKVEREKKFRNPQDLNPSSDARKEHPGCDCDQFNNTLKPPNWEKPICELGFYNDTGGDGSNLYVGWALNNIDLQVWMKTSALPNFRKPYRTLDQEVEPFNDGEAKPKGVLPAGNYTLYINYNYNVDQFNIKKSFVITRESWIGPRNMFLPIIYMITGCFILVAMGLLFIIAKVKQRFFKEST